MSLFMDASVGSLALRRDAADRGPEVAAQLCIHHGLTMLSTDSDFH